METTTSELRPLSSDELTSVSGGFVCGGVCVLGAIAAGVGLFAAGVSVGQAL